MRQAILSALRGEPDLLPKISGSLRERIDEGGRVARVVAAAEALEPILADAVRSRPSRLSKLGLRSAHLLASLAEEDEASNGKLAAIAKGSSVGIVFVDVADFTRFTAEKGDEAAIQLLEKLHKVVESCTAASKGECVKHLGDGYLLAFPGASQAIRAALALRDSIKKKRGSDETLQVRLRIAVHAGEPLIEQDDMLGHDVNLTARLLDHCKPDEVIVSEAAKELGEKKLRSVRFAKRRNVKIKGLSSRVTVYSAAREEGDGRGR
jgi:class 3 adenylate cyclase